MKNYPIPRGMTQRGANWRVKVMENRALHAESVWIELRHMVLEVGGLIETTDDLKAYASLYELLGEALQEFRAYDEAASYARIGFGPKGWRK